MKSRGLRSAIGAGIILALGLSGCAAADSPETGEEAAPLVIGTSGTYKPLTFSDGGTLSGYDIDWAEAIGEKLGRPVEFVEGQLAGLLTGLQSGQYDLVMSSLTITPEREESIDFSDSYLADGVVAVTLESNDSVVSISELDGLRVGVIGGSGYQAALEELGGYTELVEYPDAPTGFADLKNGRIDVFAAGRIPASDFVANDSTAGESLKIVGEPLALLPAGIGIAKGNTELIDEINAAIAELKAEGKGDEIAEKWFGFTIPGYTD